MRSSLLHGQFFAPPTLESLEPRLLLSVQPYISEFLADNKTGLTDYQSDHPDWIEIHNPDTQAVDLTGWDLKDGNTLWPFPAGTTIGPEGYLVVFASGKGKAGYTPAPPAGELHTNFKISKDGEYLGLLNPTGTAVSEYNPFPPQTPDISYGIAQEIDTTSLVLPGDTAKYFVPAGPVSGWAGLGFDDSGWKTGATGLGYANLVTGLSVHNVKASINVGDLSTAETVLATPADQSGSWTETRAVFNCDNDGGGAGHYVGAATGEANFPGFTSSQDNFVTEVTGYVTIPASPSNFQWTFGVNSDDGFGLTITGATVVSSTNATNATGTDDLEYAYPRGASDTFGVFSFPAAGTYAIHLVYYENGGGSSGELFAAAGAQTGFNSALFHLVGDTADGGLAVTSLPPDGTGGANTGTFASLVATNVRADVQGVNATMYVRIPFSIADPSALQTLTLEMQYDDGYVAYLNGVEIAAKNAPASPAWNSAATASRTDAQAVVAENVDVSQYRYLLRADNGDGIPDNVLAIQVLNSSASDGDLLIVPELAQITEVQLGEHYFAVPTPGQANTDQYWMQVKDTKFSSDRGYYTAPFNLTITTATAGAAIYYTTDGSAPSPTNGTLYTVPIPIQTTATVRAAAYLTGYEPTDIDTETYIFPADVLNQPADPAGFPTSWNGTAADYQMDPDIVNNPLYSDMMLAALESLPTVSLVTTVADMFGPAGLYSNPNQESPNLEVPSSIEWLNTDGSSGFQIDAGLSIYGGAFRDMSLTRKKTFRVMFSSQYGPSKLDYPIFSDDPSAATSFNTLIFRAGSNDAWNNWGGSSTQYITDLFMHETQLALGDPSARGRFVNLYIDGLYWGLYEVSERPDSSFSASYFGGDESDWDGLNYDKPTGSSTTALTAWNDLITEVRAGLGDLTSFEKIQGNNADGTPNAGYSDMLDVGNYINYMLGNIYGGTGDWPWHNYYLGIEKSPATGFKFYDWDSEGAIVIWSSLDTNVLPTIAGQANTGDVAEPWSALANNSEFRSEVADYVYSAFFNDGPLTAQACYDRYDALAEQVAPAIVGESARWGDQATTVPYTLDNWQTTCDYVLNTYMPQRSAIVLQQLKDAGFYPSFDPPTMLLNGTAKHGGTFMPGDVMSLTAPAGTIYYTTDGSDPRPLGGGAPNPAEKYTAPRALQRGTHVMTRVYLNGQWSALSQATFYADLAPSIRITEIMYNPGPPTAAEIAAGYTDNNDFEYVEIQNISATATLPLEGLRFSDGIGFTFPAMSLAPGAYVLVVKDPDAFHFRYPTFAGTIAGTYTGSLSNAGEEIQLDSPIGGVVQDFTYKDGWFSQTDGEGFSLTVRDPAQDLSLWDLSDGWRASAAPGGTPGYSDTLLTPGSVIINEVLAHPSPPYQDTIELRNVSSAPVNVTGWFLSQSKSDLTMYEIPAEPDIAPGGYLVLYADQTFGSAFLLSDLGGDLYLSSDAGGLAGGYRQHVTIDATPLGVSIGVVTKSTGGTDFTLLAYPTLGSANAPAYVDDLAINEVMYHPMAPSPAEQAAGFTDSDDFEYVEIRNNSTTASHPLSDYFVSGGIGFTFGWYGAGGTDAGESWTLEQGATATWNATLPAGQATYEVFARWDALDGEGQARSLDGQASYAIQHVGGTATVLCDQSPGADAPAGYQDADGWVSLGSYTFDGAGQVVLTRGSGNPDNWTIADQVKFVGASGTVVVNNPVLDSPCMRAGRTVLGPGQYAVIVSNYAAFDMRYGIAAHNIPVAGVYTGHLNNAGDMVELMLAGNPEPTGDVPYYRIDHVNYGNSAPWPVEADGAGSSLNRINPAAYGNDSANWQAGNDYGTPGAANIPLDPTAPTVPADVAGKVTVGPIAIHLTWAAATDAESYVAFYKIYRDGTLIGTSTTTAFDDTSAGLAAVTPYSYQVSAVNRDQYEGVLSAAAVVTVPGIQSFSIVDSTHVQITFTEPLDPASAVFLPNYVFGGGSRVAASLAAGGTVVTLTVSQMVPGCAYSVTIQNLGTVSGNQVPSGQNFTFTFAPPAAGYMTRECWEGISGTAVTDLTSNANYPNNPTEVTYPTSFEAPVNWADNYGTRMQGYVYPPVSGYYTFWIASDDNSELLLSTDESPNNATVIASVTSWTNYRDYTAEASQQSAAIYLSAGQRYYIEALQKEGTGGDSLSVRWQLPGGVWENPADPSLPIPGNRLSPYVGTADLTPPTTPTGLAAQVVSTTQINLTWAAAVDPESGVSRYTIYRDGVSIGTATTTSYSDTTVSGTTRHSYQVTATNGGMIEGTRSAALSIAVPALDSVEVLSPTSVRLTFSEPITPASAQAVASYTMTGVTIQSASLQSDQLTVLLTTKAIAFGTSGTLTAAGVRTVSGNALVGGTSQPFTFGGSIVYHYWSNFNGSLDQLLADPDFPNNPSGSEVLTSFDAPHDWADSYGSQIRGYIYPPTTGYYYFWIASDDTSRLYLSTDDTTANKVQIANVDGWTGWEQWSTYASQESAAIYLVAGQRYYIEAIQQEGGGGDNLSVAWQIPGTTFNTSNGLPIAGSYLSPYVAPPTGTTMTVSVNSLTTADSTPPLSGTVSDATAAVTVNVNGRAFAAVNNGNGTWTLPNNAIQPPLAQGTYEVTVSATVGSQIVFDTTTHELVVAFGNNTPPTATISGAPALGYEGTAINLTANVTDPDVGDTHTYAWTVTRSGIQVATGTASTLSFTPTDNGSYAVSLLVADEAGGEGAASTTIPVNNVAPVVEAGPNQAVAEGQIVSLSGAAFTDPGSGDTHTATVNWGDGTPTHPVAVVESAGAGGVHASHVYADNGTYVVTLTVTDDDGGIASDTLTITASNVAPTAAITGVPANSPEGTAITLGSTVSDPGTADTFTYAWVVKKNGVQFATGTSHGITFTPDDNGTYTAALTVTDDDGGVGAATASITVTNVAPTPTITGAPASSPEGTPITLGSTVSDPGTLDTFTYAWLVKKNGTQFATGTSAGITFTPDTPGAYTAALTVTDNDGGVGAATATITVIDTTPPTAAVVAVSPNPRNSAVGSMSIVFSEPVVGFDLADLSLTRGGGGNLLTGSQTLTTSDGGVTWTLGNLAGLTGASGTYALSLTAAGSGIADLAGNLMAQNAGGTWLADMTPPVVSVDFLSTYDTTPPLSGHVDDPTATVRVTVNSVQYAAVNRGDGTWAVADNVIGPLAAGQYDVQVTATDPLGNVGSDTTTNELQILVPQVVGRYVFYNNSYWDGKNAAANAADDGAIAPDKHALLPGQTATFANYTSYSRGINGLMIDVSNLPPGITPTAADFEFRVGNSNTPTSWALLPTADAPTITIRRGAGAGGSDRITLIFPDGTAAGQWLRVKVLSGGDIGLAGSDVFYFGNAIGEVGDSPTDAKVTVLDVSGTRANQTTFLNPPSITDPYDFNRDHAVNTVDVSLVRSNQTTFLNALKIITVPAESPLGLDPMEVGEDGSLLASLPIVPLGEALGTGAEAAAASGDSGTDGASAAAGDIAAASQASGQESPAYATVASVSLGAAATTAGAVAASGGSSTSTMDALAAAVEASPSPDLGAGLGTGLIDALAAGGIAVPLSA